MNIVFIVRRFGPVGGMEKYVYELTKALLGLGVSVKVICNSTEIEEQIERLDFYFVGNPIVKPRWLSMVIFSWKVGKVLRKLNFSNHVIHSHERSAFHDVTTFHGPPFAKVKLKPWWKRISLRIKVWLYLEKRELCSKNVKIIIPNSQLISSQLQIFYPQCKSRITQPGYPGIDFQENIYKKDDNLVLFVGKEWKRKGLAKAIEIVKRVNEKNKEINFIVIGPKDDEVKHLFKHYHGNYQVLGWIDPAKYYEKAKLLIHPALEEPYGMAVSEATSYGTRVLISKNCGIASRVTDLSGSVLSHDDSLDTWSEFFIKELDNEKPAKLVGETWHELALKHIEIYKKVINENSN